MNKFKPIQYIRKYAVPIMISFVAATAVLYAVLHKLQTYTAEMVIDSVYEQAEKGLNPDETKFDESEIFSSSVISQALSNLGLDMGKYPIDNIRTQIKVEQIEDETVNAVNAALNKSGEVSELQSTKYRVSYTMGSGETPELTRAILDEILDVYFTEFSKHYVNTSSVVNSTSDLNNTGFDYIEQVELIDEAMNRTIKNLSDRADATPDFYAVNTGYSFQDLTNQFTLLQDTEVSSLYAYILRHRATKNVNALLTKYRQRVQNFEFDKETNQARVDEVEGILATYVSKLRESDNTAKSDILASSGADKKNSNVLGEVVSPNYTTEEQEIKNYDQTTEYEKLLQNWIDISNDYESSILEAAYCQYIIDCFSGNIDGAVVYQNQMAAYAGGAGDKEMLEQSMFTGIPEACTEQDMAYVEGKLYDLISRMNGLYEVTTETDSEYNEYLGAEYIKVVSSNHVREGIRVKLFTLIGACVFLFFGCFSVIILGRIGEIVEYMAFTDHQYQLPNRVACDRFIRQHAEKVLPDSYGCILYHILNQSELNDKVGRKVCDAALNYMITCLKNTFKEGTFIGYNGSGQFLLFTQQSSAEELQRMTEQINHILVEYYRGMGLGVRYEVGISESKGSDCYSIRGLIGIASKRMKTYEAGTFERTV